MRYCTECGRASCGTCGRSRRAPAGGNGSAGGWFWGILLGVGIVFWPSIFVHGPHRMACEIAWYGFMGTVVLFILIAASVADAPKGRRGPNPKTGVPLTPPPSGPWPDLRESDVFTGKR